MPLRIQEINIQKAGPLANFKMKPGSLNVIYGRNEQGKTHLVEFLIRTLFRNAKKWGLRDEKSAGNVLLSGITKEAATFSPTSKKLEDFWENDGGLPADFSKLLVVKGAELEIESEQPDQVVLKKYLSGQQVLDDIEKRISPTIQSTQINDGVFSGPSRGENKSQGDLKNQVEEIRKLFEQVDNRFSGGERQTLLLHKKDTEGYLAKQDEARRFRAFQISQDLEAIKLAGKKIDRQKIQEVRSLWSQYWQKSSELKEKEKEQSHLGKDTENYNWLMKAKAFYQDGLTQRKLSLNPWFIFLTGILAAGTLALLYFRLFWESGAALIVTFLSGFFLFRMAAKDVRRREQQAEFNKLESEFFKRFQTKLTGLPLLDATLEKVQTAFQKFQFLEQHIEDEKNRLAAQSTTLNNLIGQLTGKQSSSKDWDNQIQILEKQLQDLEAKYHQKDKELARLKVEPNQFLSEDPGVPFNENLFYQKQSELEDLTEQIRNEEIQLDQLKQNICHVTSDAINQSWDVLIHNLQKKQQEVLEAYQQVTAKILGKMAVLEVLQNLRKDEMTKIKEGLASPEILKPLKSITKRYSRLNLQDGQLICVDDYNEFPLSDLSTGAQEQVLLALRIGFAQKLTRQNEPLFLILDDAFQYSDWQRRENLMDQVVELAQSGWQILYLTMDDHIRDLFIKRGKRFKDFQMAELKGIHA